MADFTLPHFDGLNMEYANDSIILQQGSDYLQEIHTIEIPLVYLGSVVDWMMGILEGTQEKKS